MLGGKCVYCGSTDRLEFDHKDNDRAGSKRRAIANLIDASWARVEAELHYCQLLCNPCHRQKSIHDHGKNVSVHGMLSMYINKKCRCDECRKANAEYKKQYSLRRA